MRILLDANIPVDFRHAIEGHDVQTARFAGLNNVDDDELLDRITGRFDALVTMDANLAFQQNTASRPFAIIILCARTNRIGDLKPLVPNLLSVLSSIEPGQVREVK